MLVKVLFLEVRLKMLSLHFVLRRASARFVGFHRTLDEITTLAIDILVEVS